MEQHCDLYTLLHDAAKEAGVELRWNSEVVKVCSSDMSVTLKDGEVIRGDVIVGADGRESTVRSTCLGDNDFVADDEKTVFFNFQIPTSVVAEALLQPSLVSQWSLLIASNFADCTSFKWTIWLGDNFLVHGSPLVS